MNGEVIEWVYGCMHGGMDGLMPALAEGCVVGSKGGLIDGLKDDDQLESIYQEPDLSPKLLQNEFVVAENGIKLSPFLHRY